MHPIRHHVDVLLELYPVAGRDVIDIGAGTGAFARGLSRNGARVTAIEIAADKVEALSELDGVAALQGTAQALPVESQSQDLACFMFSLHHVPAPVHGAAFDEVRRVLRRGGRLHAVDPLPRGGATDILQPVDDESDVRTQAQAALGALAGDGFRLLHRSEYALRSTYTCFDAWVEHAVSTVPERARRLPGARAEMQRRFDAMAVPCEEGFELQVPCVCFHFERDA